MCYFTCRVNECGCCCVGKMSDARKKMTSEERRRQPCRHGKRNLLQDDSTSSTILAEPTAAESGTLEKDASGSGFAYAVKTSGDMSPAVLSTYCYSLAKLYGDVLKEIQIRALNVDLEIKKLMDSSGRTRLQLTRVRKSCRRVMAVYVSDMKAETCKVADARREMCGKLGAAIALTARMSCTPSNTSTTALSGSTNKLGIATSRENTTQSASLAGELKESDKSLKTAECDFTSNEITIDKDKDSDGAAAAAAVAAAKLLSTGTQRERNRVADVLALLVRGYQDLEDTMLRHLHRMEILVQQELETNYAEFGRCLQSVCAELVLETNRMRDVAINIKDRLSPLPQSSPSSTLSTLSSSSSSLKCSCSSSGSSSPN